MSLTYMRRAAIAVALFAVAGCTVKDTHEPPLAGPSGLALTLQVNAVPDSINQDGGSQSSVRVTAIGADGRPMTGLPLRLDMMVNGVAQDYGTLSARSIVTNNDGVASAVYTAPPSPSNGLFGTCSGLPGNCVSIVATATATNFTTANPEQVVIRLVPTGVVLPPASDPVPAFTISPSPVNFNVPSTFDASTSTPGSGATSIVSYNWNFGDGSSATGRTASHTYTSGTLSATSYNVTLTVTNDRGLTKSTTQAVSVIASPSPTGDFVFSPAQPQVNQTIVFNADSIRAAPGHTIVQFSWIFGDGGTGSGFLVSHAFSSAGTYNVTLTVADESGQRLTVSHPVAVGTGTGAPFANFTFSPSSPVTVGTSVTFDASSSTPANGATIQSYQWNFGDSGGTVNTSTSTTTHSYAAPGFYNVSLTVIDSQGRISVVTTRPIQVQ